MTISASGGADLPLTRGHQWRSPGGGGTHPLGLLSFANSGAEDFLAPVDSAVTGLQASRGRDRRAAAERPWRGPRNNGQAERSDSQGKESRNTDAATAKGLHIHFQALPRLYGPGFGSVWRATGALRRAALIHWRTVVCADHQAVWFCRFKERCGRRVGPPKCWGEGLGQAIGKWRCRHRATGPHPAAARADRPRQLGLAAQLESAAALRPAHCGPTDAAQRGSAGPGTANSRWPASSSWRCSAWS